MKLDELDIAILKELKANSKLTFKEIGAKLHLTGQAVGNRVTKLLENNVIENFTININENYLGLKNVSYVRIYMKDNSHDNVLNLINEHDEIVEAYKTGSDCCYVLKIENESNQSLTPLLDKILPFANYQISMVLDRLK